MNEPIHIPTLKINEYVDFKTGTGQETFLAKLERFNPQPGETVIIWTARLTNMEYESISNFIKQLQKHYPFVLFVVLPCKDIIDKLEILELKDMLDQINKLKDTLESTILAKV